MNVAIRAGGDADRAYVLDLGRRTAMDSVSTLRDAIPAMVEVSFERLVTYCFEQSHRLFVAHDGATRLGFVLYLDALPDEVTLMPQGFIAYMAVEPARRKAGIAAALLTHAEDQARDAGLRIMALMVTEENVAARALYDAAGYVTERRLLVKPL